MAKTADKKTGQAGNLTGDSGPDEKTIRSNDTTTEARGQAIDPLSEFVERCKQREQDQDQERGLGIEDVRAYVQHSGNLQAVCPWLADYIAFSKKWSPRSFEGYHEAIGLWVLSTVAARRVRLDFGGERYPNLMMLMVGKTSIWAKSTAADIGPATLRAAGLDWLLAADESTPQKLILSMAGFIPPNYDSMSLKQQERARLKMTMPGQRGWFYEEFGQKVKAMMQDGGVMGDFRGLLRRMDDNKGDYDNETIKRGSDFVEKPYLALLGNLTPADLGPVARKGGALWGDGLLARFALVCPGPDAKRSRARFPKGERIIPAGIVQGLRDWHERLGGTPEVRIEAKQDEKGKPTGTYTATEHEIGETRVTLTDAAEDLNYAYNDALGDIVEDGARPEDLDGNHIRFAEKALRIAMMFASLSNNGLLDVPQMACAIQITERWRFGLYDLYDQVNSTAEQAQEQALDELVLDIVRRLEERKGPPTVREMMPYFPKGTSTETARGLAQVAVFEGNLEEIEAGRTTRYKTAGRRYGAQV